MWLLEADLNADAQHAQHSISQYVKASFTVPVVSFSTGASPGTHSKCICPAPPTSARRVATLRMPQNRVTGAKKGLAIFQNGILTSAVSVYIRLCSCDFKGNLQRLHLRGTRLRITHRVQKRLNRPRAKTNDQTRAKTRRRPLSQQGCLQSGSVMSAVCDLI